MVNNLPKTPPTIIGRTRFYNLTGKPIVYRAKGDEDWNNIQFVIPPCPERAEWVSETAKDPDSRDYVHFVTETVKCPVLDVINADYDLDDVRFIVTRDVMLLDKWLYLVTPDVIEDTELGIVCERFVSHIGTAHA